MISVRSTTLMRECYATLGTCSAVLFLIGFLLAQQLLGDFPLSPSTLIAIVLIGTAVLLVAMLRIRTRLSTTDRLESQLAGMAFDSQPTSGSLHPILDRSRVAQSWNRLVEQFQDRQSDQAIERRLSQDTGNRGGNERFARALRSLSEGIAITDRHGKLSYVNTAWVNIVADPENPDASPVGKGIADSLSVGRFTNWDQVVGSLLDGTRPMKWELHVGNISADGVLQLERMPLEGRAEESEGFVWALKDTTQSALARESHEQFLGSATHELRTPITNIKAYTESLIEVEDISPTQQKEFFNIIHSEADRLGRLLNQLLDIQQLEAGSMTLSVSSFDMLRMVHEVQEHINPLIKEKELKFICRIPPNLKMIDADKEKVISCLVNLLGNAIKYTPEGGEVRLSAEQQEQEVCIAVEDTGIGIAEEELPKIFERFYRCQDARVAELEGNGLGLAFAMEVARLHHGELTVESKLNEGSRFTLKLPMRSRG